MCGIATIIGLRGEQLLSGQIVQMARALAHRGPDDEGYTLFNAGGVHSFLGNDSAIPPHSGVPGASNTPHIDAAIEMPSFLALGHRRLSIFDVSFAGHQPMSYRDRYWIVFNGEIYNFIELKQELAPFGYTFVSETDTEVIMAAYDRWGTDCVQRFNGMWAFVLYDAVTGALFISRDRFGIKPLYYYRDASRIILSSEIKAILACDSVDTRPNDAYCAHFLRTGGDDYTTETAFQNIFRIPPASHVSSTVDALSSGTWPVRTYWTVMPTKAHERFHPSRASDIAGTYRELLKDSVRLRLRADVPVGLALSGGLDSSTLAYLIREVLQEKGASEPFETFSSVFKADHLRAFNESGWIDQLAERFTLVSNQIEPIDGAIAEEHGKMIRALETPTPTLHMGGWHTYRCAHEHGFKVILDGQGADELLAGYYIFAANYFLDLRMAELPDGYRKFSSIPSLPRKYVAAGIAGNLLRRCIGRKPTEKVMTRMLKWIGAKNPQLHVTPLNEALNLSLKTDIVNLLHYGDKLAMSRSIESRHPFLDYRLVEFLASVPAVYKMHDGWTKYVARVAMDGILPDSIVWRKDKMGWPDPTDYWMKGVLARHIETSVNHEDFASWSASLDTGHRSVATSESQSQLRAFNLSAWYRAFFVQS